MNQINKAHYSYLLYVLVLIYALYCLFKLNYLGLSTPFVQHDDLPYMNSFLLKLKEEGRWLVYCLSNGTGYQWIYYINTSLIKLLNIALFAFFLYQVFAPLTQPRDCILLVVIALLMPSFIEQNYWPITTFPTYVVLALSCLLKKRLAKFIYFPLLGILFNGCLNQYYFLLPLLFMADDDSENKKLITLMTLWMIGFLVGFLFAELMTYWLTGDIIRIASWRNPQPIKSLADLAHNTQNAIRSYVHYTVAVFYEPWRLFLLCFILQGILIKRKVFLTKKLFIIAGLIIVFCLFIQHSYQQGQAMVFLALKIFAFLALMVACYLYDKRYILLVLMSFSIFAMQIPLINNYNWRLVIPLSLSGLTFFALRKDWWRYLIFATISYYFYTTSIHFAAPFKQQHEMFTPQIEALKSACYHEKPVFLDKQTMINRLVNVLNQRYGVLSSSAVLLPRLISDFGKMSAYHDFKTSGQAQEMNPYPLSALKGTLDLSEAAMEKRIFLPIDHFEVAHEKGYCLIRLKTKDK